MVLSVVETLPIVRIRPSQGEQMEVGSSSLTMVRAVGFRVLVKKSVKVVYYSNLSLFASSILTPYIHEKAP